VPQTCSPAGFPTNWQTIRYDNVSFSYGNEDILKKVMLTVKRGQVIALVGESGSGKSSFVNLLERFYDPTAGAIYLDDTPIQNIGLKELRSNNALVTQDVFLFSDTIERNIQAGDFAKPRDGIVKAAELANANDFVSRLPEGYQSSAGDRGGRLSGGEKQRISIARAFFKDAPILILDEATSALDSVSEQEVQRGLERLMEGRTVFIIAHRLATVLKANRILVLKKGAIVEEGTHDELVRRNGEYRRFYELQMAH
jgi:ATP-binding cassette, subfamily B, bacterial MsbA